VVGLIFQMILIYLYFMVYLHIIMKFPMNAIPSGLIGIFLEWGNLISLFLSILIAWAVTIPIKRKYAIDQRPDLVPPPAS